MMSEICTQGAALGTEVLNSPHSLPPCVQIWEAEQRKQQEEKRQEELRQQYLKEQEVYKSK